MTAITKPGFFLIGGGKTGASLAWYLSRENRRVLSLVEKNKSRYHFLRKQLQWPFLSATIKPELLSESSVIILAVSDSQIADLVLKLSGYSVHWKNKIVIHCSGTQPVSLLNPLKDSGAYAAAFHPIIAFSGNPADNPQLDDCWFDIEADDPGYKRLLEVMPFEHKRFLRVDSSSKSRIHLASVFFSNFILAMAATGEEILDTTPSFDEEVKTVFLPLIQSAFHHYKNEGIPAAITGPAIRGDGETIRRHLDLLKAEQPDVFEIYRILTKKILTLSNLPHKRQNMILDYLKNL